MFKLFPIALIGAVAAAQTQIDLRTQTRNVDFTAAASTKPLKTGTALPATCAVGDMFFKTDASAGANLYGCPVANSWAVEGGLSGQNCWIDTVSQTLRCRDTNGNVYAVVETSAGAVPNQWVTYIDSNGVPHTSQPTAAAVGATADPGSNGVPYRSGMGTATPATADNLSGSFFCQATGAGNAYLCNLTPPVASYNAGTTYWFRANVANTGPATINFNSLGPKSIVKQADQSLASGDIKAGQWVMATYDGANMQMQSQTGNALLGGVSTVFGRAGAVGALAGDYTTAQVTESGNLYFTNARGRAAFTGTGPVTLSAATGAIDCPTCITTGTAADTDLYGSFPHLSVVRIQGRPVASMPPGDMQYLGWNNAAGQWEPKTVPSALLSSVFGRTGAVVPASGDYTTAQVAESGNLYFTNARVWAAISGAGPIAFNSNTGAYSCPTCITSSTQADTDLSGTFPHLSVVRIQGRPVAAIPPADQQYLGWNVSANYWEPKTLPNALVTSVFGRTGQIAAQTGDYSFTQVSGTASASQLPAVAIRTDQSNTISAGTQDFSRAAHTLPLKSGLKAGLPSTCTTAELYFATDAPAGSNVYGCTAANTWAVQGNVTVMSDGFAVGTSGTMDFVTGTGLMTVITATGSQSNVQTALDTAVIQTQPGEQGGAALLCVSGSGSGSAYTCSLNPTLGSYTQGMVLHWIPDLSASGGVTTLNVDTLGPRPVKLPDGVSNPAATDILAGRLHTIWYDGAAFRLPAAAATGGSGGAVSSVFSRAGSVTAQSGDYTTAQVTESGNLYFTNARAQSAMSGRYESPLTLSAPLSRTVNTISLPAATSGQNGYLASADWSTFNAKQAAISGAPSTWPALGTAAAHAATDFEPALGNPSVSGYVLSSTTAGVRSWVAQSGGGGGGTWGSITGTLSNQTDLNSVLSGKQATISGAPGTWPSFAAVATSGSKSDVGLSNVENTALSTWAGTTNIVTLGTLTTGVWHGTAIADSYISSAATWSAKQSAITGAPSTWPALATVATSGSYSDLSSKPTLGTASSHASTDFQTAIGGAPGTWPSFGAAALLNVGTTAGTVAAGNDSRFGGSGGSVNVNGSSVSSPNFNASTPAAGSGYNNATLQVAGSNVSIQVPLSVDAPAWQVCNPAGCGSETSNGYYMIMNPNGVTFDECGVNLAIAGTGSSVVLDVQDSTGTSIFGATKLVVPINTTTGVFQAAFSGSPYTAAKGAKFRAVVTQNDSGGTAQFAYLRCRVH